MDTFLATVFIIICLLLVVVVLLQKGRGGGLGAAFGGAGSSAFGTRTGDVFTWVTIVLTALFLLLAIGSNFVYRPKLQQVSPPKFSVPSGQAYKDQIVEITCDTPGAQVVMTTDGSEPTRNSPRYVIPVKLGKLPVTIKARAFRTGYNPSEVVTVTYTTGATTRAGGG